MKLMRMEHIGINTGNFEESLKFYRDILGLRELTTVELPEFSITYLALSDEGRIELFNYGERQQRLSNDESRVGYRHIALEADDVEAWEQHLKENNIKIIMPTKEIMDLGIQCLLCEDPDGIIIEICKIL